MGTHQDADGMNCQGLPFQRASKEYNEGKFSNNVTNHIVEYCSPSASASTRTSLLLSSAVMDESFHLDGLCIVLRDDSIVELLGLHQLYNL